MIRGGSIFERQRFPRNPNLETRYLPGCDTTCTVLGSTGSLHEGGTLSSPSQIHRKTSSSRFCGAYRQLSSCLSKERETRPPFHIASDRRGGVGGFYIVLGGGRKTLSGESGRSSHKRGERGSAIYTSRSVYAAPYFRPATSNPVTYPEEHPRARRRRHGSSRSVF